jgi:hypothetical protein
MYVVHGQEMGASRLFCRHVVDVGTSNTQAALVGGATTGTLATLFNWSKVFGIDGIAKVEDASRGDGIAEALGEVSKGRLGKGAVVDQTTYCRPCWPHAVEHVGAESD